MRWLFIGAGAVGGYFGGRLHQSGIPVQFLVRPLRAAALQKRGLSVQSPRDPFTARVIAVDSPEAVGPIDVIVLAVKAYHLPDLWNTLDRLPGVPILPILNGIEHIDTLSMRYPGRILGGVARIESTLDADGSIVHYGVKPALELGALDRPLEPCVKDLAADLQHAGIHVVMSPRILQNLWRKYLTLDLCSALTAITGLPFYTLFEIAPTRHAMEALAREFLAVAEAAGAGLPEAWGQGLSTIFPTVPPISLASMARDKAKGLPLEADHIQGGIVRLGTRYHVPTPLHEMVWGLLAPFSQGGSTLTGDGTDLHV